MSKVLVAFFSKTGEQYGVGEITKGNTAILAEIIAKKTNADIFEIKVKDDKYPNKYSPLVQFAKEEKDSNARPEITGSVDNIEDYDVVFLGYPNWWADMPMAVYTFLEKYDLSNKKIYHFCTHEGSGGVRREGLAMYGHIPQKNEAEAEKLVDDWLKKINFEL